METKYVDDSNTLIDLIKLVKANTYDELDCSLEVYIDYLMRVVYKNKNIWSWVLYDDENPVGYLFGERNTYLWNDFVVTGLFVIPELQGRDLMGVMLNDLIIRCFEDGAKRIRWHSHVFQDKEWWQKRVSKFGGVVQEYKMFHCNLDGTAEKAFKDKH